jgi:septal ring factor EnvC (AmiA/AmiB activator)
VLARYGTQKNIGNLKWRGLFIAGREGQQVISVFHGRVVYADWLRGFGLLLILEHGDGYMTLYGHNQSLHKAVGDWVKAGEVIASLGNTGDAAQPGLYFEIRHNGEPRDPLIWCRAR